MNRNRMTRISETNHGEKTKLIYEFRMKGIDKRKHEHLMKCLEELRLQTTDAEQGRSVETEIATLSEIYDSYISFIHGVETQADRYNSLYKNIQTNTYKELRRVRRGRNK